MGRATAIIFATLSLCSTGLDKIISKLYNEKNVKK